MRGIMKVRNFMNSDVITVETKTSILEAENIMRMKGIKRLPVMEKDKLIGLVTKHMILEASPSSGTSLSIWELNYLLTKMRVDDIMVKNPITIPSDYPLEQVIWLGKKQRVSGFPVVDDGKLVGIITEHDITGVLSKVLGLESQGVRITIESLGNKLGELRKIIGVLDNHATPLLSIVSIPGEKKGDWVIVLRAQTHKAEGIVKDLRTYGFNVTGLNP
jgi:acetoin utilization protein AcuB